MAGMDGTVALVTGAASGIGKATSVGLARDGATVVLLVRDAGLASRRRSASHRGPGEGQADQAGAGRARRARSAPVPVPAVLREPAGQPADWSRGCRRS